jgi:hypothetical protein
MRRRFDVPAESHAQAFRDACDELDARVIAVLRPNEIGEVNAQMLSHHCLICGRGLTDPISMARLIGPECADEYQIPTIRQIAVAVGGHLEAA